MPLKDKRLSQFRLYQLPDLCLRCLQFVHKFWKYVTKDEGPKLRKAEKSR